jgi:hypothetical protein
LHFFKRIDLAEVFPAGISRKLVKNWILEPSVVKFRGILKYFQVWGSFQQVPR